MKDKFTPGPWHSSEKGGIMPGHMVWAGDYLIANCGKQNGEDKYNARIIAAAPDLLAAAREVLDTLNDGPADRECPLTGRPKMVCDCVGHRMLKNAITKAEAI